MANLRCDLCEQEAAVLMQTNLGNGDTVAVGASCLLTFALAFANEMAGGASDEAKTAVAELGGAVIHALGLHEGLPEPLAKPKPRGRPRKPVHVDTGEQGINIPPGGVPHADMPEPTLDRAP